MEVGNEVRWREILSREEREDIESDIERRNERHGMEGWQRGMWRSATRFVEVGSEVMRRKILSIDERGLE